jgi:hypothetical protein
VALDAGDSYVLIEDGLPIRCMRDLCGGDIPIAMNAPAGLRATWRTPLGLAGLLENGAVVRFVPATISGESPPTVAAIPPGAWEPVFDASPSPLPAEVIRGRFQAGEEDLLWLTDGQLYGLDSGQWTAQGLIPEGHTFWSEGERWGVLGPQGLLTLSPVSDATP